MELPNGYRPLDAWMKGFSHPSEDFPPEWGATPKEAARSYAASALANATLRIHAVPIWTNRSDWIIADATLWAMESGPYAMPGWDWHVRDVDGRAGIHEMCSGCDEEGLCPAHPKEPECAYYNVTTS